MKTWKRIGKIVWIALICLCALAFAVVGVLNIAKFALYRDYYAAESALCRNPGLNDGFVCQGIAAVDGEDRILVSGYMKDKSASRIYVTTLDGESCYVTLHCDGAPYTGHAGGSPFRENTSTSPTEARSIPSPCATYWMRKTAEA